MQDLTGRIVWVTGAGTGIGRAIALAFAQAGARVVLTGRRPAMLAETAALLEDAGYTAMQLPADVADADDVARAHAEIVAALGEVQILVNNAGTNAAKRHWRDLAPTDMARIVDVNLKGPFLCSIAVLPAMRRAGGGTIIHVVSNAATGIFAVAGPTYTASKHGARAMSATLNAEEGIHGIRSVCINPGEVETPILDSRPKPPSAADRALMVQPEDIAVSAVFAARLPSRACMAEMLITPTDNNFYRSAAKALAEMQS
jgi:NADP-dependent 3-hydroxy acid dehydrogenase YdfG